MLVCLNILKTWRKHDIFVYIKPRSTHLFSSVPTRRLLRSLTDGGGSWGGGCVEEEKGKGKSTLSGKQCSFWALTTELNQHTHRCFGGIK